MTLPADRLPLDLSGALPFALCAGHVMPVQVRAIASVRDAD